MFGGLVVELDEHPHPGGAFDQGGHRAGAVGADDQVAFPVAGHGPVVGLGGPFGDVDHPHDLRPRRRHPASWSASGTPCTQARGEFFAQLTFGLDEDRLVDRLMRHPPLWLVGMVPAQPLGRSVRVTTSWCATARHLRPTATAGSRSTTAWVAGRRLGPVLGQKGAIALPAAAASISRPIVPRCRPNRRPITASDSPRSIPTRISSRSSRVNASGRGLRSRNTTTDSSASRCPNVFIEIPATAAASAHVTPRATAPTPAPPPTSASSDAPPQHLHIRSCRAHPLRPPGRPPRTR